MSKARIEFNRDICIGCQSCSGICPNWVPKMDGKVTPAKLELEEGEVALNEEAAAYCPMHAIKIVKKPD